ncbi:MAG: hypothetical protein ACREE2_02740 [Stellaceae bacterium]
MPFDGANFILSPQQMLDAALAAEGLDPVAPRRLCWHMAEQVRRHPASWAYRQQRAVELTQVAVLAAGVVSFVVLFSADRIGWGAAAAFAAFAAGIMPMLLPVNGPASWRERLVDDLREVPAAIREPALRLRARLPELGYVVGELYQDRIRLDPYLVAEYGDARAILGIWDGDTVIAHA